MINKTYQTFEKVFEEYVPTKREAEKYISGVCEKIGYKFYIANLKENPFAVNISPEHYSWDIEGKLNLKKDFQKIQLSVDTSSRSYEHIRGFVNELDRKLSLIIEEENKDKIKIMKPLDPFNAYKIKKGNKEIAIGYSHDRRKSIEEEFDQTVELFRDKFPSSYKLLTTPNRWIFENYSNENALEVLLKEREEK